MTNNKQQTAVKWLIDELIKNHGIQANLYSEFEQAKEMEIAGKEMSYDDGYKEGYKRALELVEWKIQNDISGIVQYLIGDTNKIEGGEQ
jgi:flagellar biosynthesis/type III secretory pathway protein FliH